MNWRRFAEVMGDAAVVVLLALAVLLAFVELANGETPWQWSPVADHHRAVVQVRCGSAGGTGCLIWRRQDGQAGVVLTAAHVIEHGREAVAIWRSGYQSRGPVIVRTEADVALFAVTPPADAVAVPVTQQSVPLPAALEFCGYGGPTDQLRHWWGQATHNDGRDVHSRTYALSGDSGGPVFVHWPASEGQPARVEVCSLIEGGAQRTNHGTAEDGEVWHYHHPLRSSRTSDLLAALSHQNTQRFCGPGGCQPCLPWGRRSPSTPTVPPAPRAPTQPTPIQKPDVPPPIKPDPPVLTVDYDKLAAILLAKMRADPMFRGPAGKDGLPGLPGPPGRDAPGPEAWTPAQIDDLARRLPPIHFRKVWVSGERPPIVESVHLGEGFTYRIHKNQ